MGSRTSRRFLALLQQALRAYARGEKKQAETLAGESEKQSLPASETAREARHLRKLLEATAPKSLAAVPADQKQANLSGLQFVEESVGWGQPLRNQAPVEGRSTCFLKVAGQFHDEGLFAHAPSRYVLDLHGNWSRFTAGYGLQDGHPGSVVFVLRGDGRELFRSAKIDEHRLHSIDLDIVGINRLELRVEDAGDGATSDWGVWISPTVKR